MSENKNVKKQIDRREFLKAGIGGVVGGIIGSTLPAKASTLFLPDEGGYDISFRNIHTGESFKGTYRVGDRYLPDAFDEINHVLRDFRSNEVFPIDPQLIDIITFVREEVEAGDKPYEILSGYRSPKTNAMLRKTGSGVARQSLHLTGQAVDFRLPGYSSYKLRKLAMDMKSGGVGYYKGSDFVHVDTGRIRQW